MSRKETTIRRPALVLVDSAYLAQSYALAGAAGLLEAARKARVPVFHAVLSFRADGLDGGHYFARNADLARFAGTAIRHAPGLEPRADEVVIPRTYPSAFFGTSLSASLRGLGADGVVIAGGLTSDGVRTTAIDAMQHGFLPVVAEDAVFDGSAAANDETLRALAARYAIVEPVAAALPRLTDPEPAGRS